MLYSCLVDADFLDTEAYMDIAKADMRHDYCSIPELLERLNSYYDRLASQKGKQPANQPHSSGSDSAV